MRTSTRIGHSTRSETVSGVLKGGDITTRPARMIRAGVNKQERQNCKENEWLVERSGMVRRGNNRYIYAKVIMFYLKAL